MNKFIPFAIPDIGEDEIAEVANALRSGWITTGPKVKRFESNFQEFIGGSVEAVAVNSATAGLHLALEALGVSEGDEVIIPSLTFTATAEVVRYLGANVRIVDINPVTLNIDIKAIRAAITSKTTVIMPVHYAGLSCNMDEILLLAKEFDLKVVEDAAHALPTTYRGDMIGSLESDITVFSFYANKTMTTGEGGMVVTRNLDLAKRMKIMRLHGIDRDAFDRFQSKKPAWYYEVVAPGFKYNMTDIAAAMGIHQLKKLPGFLDRRQYLAKRYFDSLSDLPLTLPMDDVDGGSHSWHLFVIRIQDNSPINRDELIQILSDQGIGSSVHYVPLHRQPYWRDKYQLTIDMFPITDKAYQAMLSIPLYTAMSDEQQDRVIQVLRKALTQ
ncbi:DegT/DnrJ/EryC1/StrS family aminotransferase [Candidatus Thioglobus sp.]|nr:DegT/DnrJ/EryC1/StrS family aminotransferase [Candidatus Thioglobus sp.]